ncbi:hypothetical protein Tco_0704762 [Tanacetum coccineum]|uniref:Uncharacterized protein n=1 Tax=Tanacetum coccineum TaxID=301880 RepID=A0ABQ4Y2W6_9ASTR
MSETTERQEPKKPFVGGSWSDNGEEDDEKAKDETCLMAHAIYESYKAYNGGNIVFGSNLRGYIISKGQICDNKCKVIFSEHDSKITKDGKVIGHANMRLIQSLTSKELVRNLPKLRIINVTFDETPPPSKTSPLVDDDLDEDQAIKLGLWYPKGTDIETVVYADSDHAGDYVDEKQYQKFVQSCRMFSNIVGSLETNDLAIFHDQSRI